jgi:hypothetical protein
MDSAHSGIAVSDVQPLDTPVKAKDGDEVVSTHVLVAEDQVEKLRELSRRTRVAQSEYLREAVDDLLAKYHKREGAK